MQADITRQEDVDALFETTLQRFGRVHALFNDAGRSARGEASST